MWNKPKTWQLEFSDFLLSTPYLGVRANTLSQNNVIKHTYTQLPFLKQARWTSNSSCRSSLFSFKYACNIFPFWIFQMKVESHGRWCMYGWRRLPYRITKLGLVKEFMQFPHLLFVDFVCLPSRFVFSLFQPFVSSTCDNSHKDYLSRSLSMFSHF